MFYNLKIKIYFLHVSLILSLIFFKINIKCFLEIIKNLMSIKKIFELYETEQKPRTKNQVWIKDVGYDEAPWYSERMGLIELEDFLSVASDNIDFVKITTTQVLGHPEKWLKSKLALYKKFSVKTYLDHGFFKRALKKGIVDEAIEAGANLGFSAIEFMDTFGDIPDWQNKAWRQRAINCGLDIIFEYHPESGWRNIQQAAPSNAKQIIKVASPFLEHGAITLLIDHEEIELQNDAANDVLCEVMEYFGKESVAFEVTSRKEAEMTWYSNVIDYFNNFGTDCNITNIMPSQVMLINLLRSGERPAKILFDRFPELIAIKNK